MLATADERDVTTATEVSHKTGVPAWRVALGNIAAGATAGCAVEAGKTATQILQTLLSCCW